MESNDWSDFFAALLEASTLSMKQTYLKKTGLFPYKVASTFLKYLEIRGDTFTTSQKKQTKDICSGWLSRIAELPPQFSSLSRVRHANNNILLALDFFD